MTSGHDQQDKQYQVSEEVVDCLLHQYELDGKTKAVMRHAIMLACEFNHATVRSEHIVLALLWVNEQTPHLFGRYYIAAEKFANGVKFVGGRGTSSVLVSGVSEQVVEALGGAQQTAKQQRVPLSNQHLLLSLVVTDRRIASEPRSLRLGHKQVQVACIALYQDSGIGLLESVGVNIERLRLKLESELALTA